MTNESNSLWLVTVVNTGYSPTIVFQELGNHPEQMWTIACNQLCEHEDLDERFDRLMDAYEPLSEKGGGFVCDQENEVEIYLRRFQLRHDSAWSRELKVPEPRPVADTPKPTITNKKRKTKTK